MTTSFSVEPAAVDPGGTSSFTATIQNTGNVEMSENIVLNYAFDEGVVYAFGEITADIGTATPTDNLSVKWEGSLPAGGTLVLTVPVVIDAASGPGQINGTMVTPVDWEVTGTTTAQVTVNGTAPPAPNMVTSVVFNPKNPTPGSEDTLTVTLENTGDADYTTNQVIDVTRSPTASFTAGEAAVTIGSVSVASLKYTIVATIPASQTQTFTLPITVEAAAEADQTCTANLTKPTGATSGTLTDTATVVAGAQKKVRATNRNKDKK